MPRFFALILLLSAAPASALSADEVWRLGQKGLAERPEGQSEGPESVAERLDAAERLLPLLVGAEEPLRVAAIEALGKIGGPALEAPLRAKLADAAPSVRAEAALALFRLRFLKRIPEYSTQTVDALSLVMRDGSADARRAAVYAFSRFAEPRAAEALSAATMDGDEFARLFAWRALGQLGEKAPRAASGDLAKESSALVRAEAVRALGLAKRAEEVPAALGADRSPHVRTAFAEALAADGDAALSPALDAIATKDSPMARAAVALASAKLRPERAKEALAQARRDPSWWVRSRGFGATEDPEILEPAVDDADLRVASAALEALGKLPGERSAAAVERVLYDQNAPLELLGTAADAAGEKAEARLASALRAASRAKAAADYPELSDQIVAACKKIAAKHPAVECPKPPEPPARFWTLRGPAPKPARVSVVTDKGEIMLELAVAAAPTHAAAMLESVRKKLYDGTVWHRVVTNFVVQGGDPRGSGWGDAGFMLRDEINRLRFSRGTLGMPRAGPNTGGCQLFITHTPTPHLDGRYTVFGRVVSGMELVDRLEPGDRILRARVE